MNFSDIYLLLNVIDYIVTIIFNLFLEGHIKDYCEC